MKLKTSNSFELKKKYDGKTTVGLKDVDPGYFGMDEKWYGGNLKRAAIYRDTSIVVLMNSERKTIDVAYILGRENEVPEEDCKFFGIEFAKEPEVAMEEKEIPMVKEEPQLTARQIAAKKAAEARYAKHK